AEALLRGDGGCREAGRGFSPQTFVLVRLLGVCLIRHLVFPLHVLCRSLRVHLWCVRTRSMEMVADLWSR
ncbi:hypothetical protein SRHO_G00253080, partial [Serrasalmus rhombeus]